MILPLRNNARSRLIKQHIPLLLSLLILYAGNSIGLELGRKAVEYYREGEKYEAENTPRGRMMAREAYEKALMREPENTLYLMAMGNLWRTMDFPENAITYYERVIELDSTYVAAHHHLADLLSTDMFYYLKLTAVSGNFRGDLDGFGQEIRDQSLHHYKAVLDMESYHVEALKGLGLFCLRAEKPDDLVAIGERIAAADPDITDGYFFMGVGFINSGEYEKAQAAFNQGLMRLTDEEHASFQAVSNLLSPSELKKYGKMDSSDQTGFETVYWRQQDPLLLTGLNERGMTHISRVTCADLLYRDTIRERRGWETDRGQVYIRYGKPDRLNRILLWGSQDNIKRRLEPPKSLDKLGQGYRGQGYRDITTTKAGVRILETWNYPGFSLTFEDHPRMEWYYFTPSSHSEYDVRIREQPSDHENEFRDSKFEFPYVVSTFKDRDPGRTLVEISLAVPVERLVVDDSLDEVRITEGIFLLDNNWEQLSKNVTDKEFELPSDSAADYLIDQRIISFAPGSYNLAVEVADRESDSFGSERAAIEIPLYDGDRLLIGDIALASGIQRGGYSVPNRQDLTVTANPLLEFTNGDSIVVYFGVYNLATDPSGRTSYEITTDIAFVDQKRNPAREFMGRFLFGRDEREGFAITSRYRDISPDIVRTITIDPANLIPGPYRIKVEAKDLITGRKRSKERSFTLISSEGPE